jgi:hypothetical protein
VVKHLWISTNQSLPPETQTGTLVVYGGKGMGKTNFIAVLAEEMDKAGLKFSVIDPLGVNWGLQYGRTEDLPGLKVLILGGVHGDIAILPTAGAVVADLVVDEAISTVIDISRRPNGQSWSMGEKIKFVTDYCNRLYERQGEKRRPIMQIIDEAGRFVPQMMARGDEKIAMCVGAIEQMVEWGRNVGIGCTLVTQRSARMAKNVSELADAMIAFRTVGPNSVDAIMGWLSENIEKERAKVLVDQVRTLERGSALIVSPGWLKVEHVVPIRFRETFDSSATPKAGTEVHAPGRATKPDLEKYKARMVETEERAKADDPKELRKRLNQVTLELNALKSKQPAPAKVDPARAREQEAERKSWVAENTRLQKEVVQLRGILKKVNALTVDYSMGGPPISSTTPTLSTPAPSPSSFKPVAPAPRPVKTVTVRQSSRQPAAEIGNSGLRRILIALAQRPQGLTKRQIGIRACLSSKSGTFDTYVSRANQSGWITKNGNLVVITDAGLQSLGDFDPLPAGRELLEYWLREFGDSGAARILRAIAEAYPNSLTKAEIGDATGLSSASGTFDTYLSRLRTLELIEGRGELRASEELFD